MAVCRRKCLLFLGARPALNLPTQACSLVDVVDPLIKNKELPKSPHPERESVRAWTEGRAAHHRKSDTQSVALPILRVRSTCPDISCTKVV